MKSRLEEKKKAIELRKVGFSYKEIQEIIPVSKGLLSGWFKYLDLSDKELEVLKTRMLERQNGGRIRASISNRDRRIQREKDASLVSKKLFINNKTDPVFLIGITLYWAEGGKRTSHFQFVNSDPEMIKFMNRWILKYLPLEDNKIRYRLFTHKIQGYEEHIGFWSNLLNIDLNLFSKTIFKPTLHSIKKNPNYNGCLRLEITRIKYLRMMKDWQKLLLEYYGNFV